MITFVDMSRRVLELVRDVRRVAVRVRPAEVGKINWQHGIVHTVSANVAFRSQSVDQVFVLGSWNNGGRYDLMTATTIAVQQSRLLTQHRVRVIGNVVYLIML